MSSIQQFKEVFWKEKPKPKSKKATMKKLHS